jgi:hypothetical protein
LQFASIGEFEVGSQRFFLITNIKADKKAFDVFIGSAADFLISPELLESHLYIGVMPLDEIADSNPPSGPASHII